MGEEFCCNDPVCAGFSYDPAAKSGCYKKNINCGLVSNPAYNGYNKPGFVPPSGGPALITVNFADVGLSGPVHVRDILAQRDLGTFTASYTANVSFHDTAFLRLTQH